MNRLSVSLLLLVLLMPAWSTAQIAPPSGPVTFCGTQAPPTAVSYTATVDGATAQPVTMTAPVAGCPAGSTHSFTLPANLFPIGTHSVVVRATNTYGTTQGPAYSVTVGIAPGPFTITANPPAK